MSISRPNIVQQENRLRTLPDEALRTMLLQMGQSGQVGSPEYLLAAGEMQARKNVRQQAAMGQPQQPPVIAELLTGINMPQGGQQMPQMAQAPQQVLPEDTGIGALPAPNMEQLDQPQYADGGVVAFSGGSRDPVRSDIYRSYTGMADPRSNIFQFTEKEKEEQKRLKEASLADALDFIRRKYVTPAVNYFAADPMRQTLANEAGPAPDITFSPNPTPANAPMTAADLRRAEAAAGDPYVTGRGATPEQSAANIAAARNQGGAPGGTPAAGAPSNAGLFGQVKSFMDQFYPASTETVPTEASAVQNRLDALKAAGVDMDPNKDLREQVMAERAGRAAEREKAGWEALGVFGLTLSSTPGDFLSAIGKAGLPALKQYSSDIKELKKLSREDDRLLAQLKSTDNELKLKVTQSGLDERQKIIDRIQNERARSGQIAASVFGGVASLEASRESKATTTTENRKSIALKEANDAVDRMTRDDPILARDPAKVRALRDSLYSQFLQQLTSGASSAPAAGSANIAARFDAKGNLIR